MDRRQEVQASVLDVAANPLRIIPRKTHAIRVGTENPIHVVHPAGFEPITFRLTCRSVTIYQVSFTCGVLLDSNNNLLKSHPKIG